VSGKVLIVEDDPDIGRLIGLKLKRAGLDPVFAADAVTAVTIARKEDPDVVLIDLGLPGGGGLVVIERMRTMPHLGMKPVIVISANEPVEAERQALEAGAVAFFSKPIDLDGLVEAIRAQLGE